MWGRCSAGPVIRRQTVNVYVSSLVSKATKTELALPQGLCVMNGKSLVGLPGVKLHSKSAKFSTLRLPVP